MNYQEALDYLYSFLDSEAKLPRTPAEFHLPRTAALLRAFGDPQQHLRSVVVAGTKGKGSTSVMLESIVRASGYRTGLWTSPHLHSYRERIQVNRQLIEKGAWVQQVAAAKPIIDRFDSAQYGSPTTFDLGFAIALRYFAEVGVELAVLEVGLGGRYDSANVVTPLVSLISSISYDHMQTLGDTLAKIAWEKAGIAKAGVPLVTVPQQSEAMASIEQVTREVGAPLWVARPGESDGEGLRMEPRFDASASFVVPSAQLTIPPLALRGAFQRENARLAAGAALLLRGQGLVIPDRAIVGGLAGASWPARMEVVDGAPPVVIDGAHNGDSAARLLEAVEEQFPGRRIVLVFGTTRDKDITRIFSTLLPAVEVLVLTHSRHPRALTDLQWLADRAEPYLQRAGGRVPLLLTSDVPEGIEEGQNLAQPNDVILVTGSLFIAAAAREALGLPAERD
jgi:dihydrofolate synthase/folylpolyglutamate synthase